VYPWAALAQAACMYKLYEKTNTGNLDQEEASGIDNQGLLKAWMLPLNKKEK
jgi:hypothetical protein